MMDFRKLVKAMPAAPTMMQNGTDPLSLTELPPNILEALIPGYGLISRYVFTTFGFDPSIFVSIGLVALACMKGGQYLFGILERAFRTSCMSSIFIDEHDDLFGMVMGWLAESQRFGSRRSLRAKTQAGSKLDDGAEDTAGDALDENGIFDYTKWSARLPPRFEPYYGQNYIYHKGTMFFFKRSQKQSSQKVQVTFSGAAEDDLLQLDCIGRSTEPIKNLLREIKIWSLNRQRNTTAIRHPTPKDRARFGGSWTKTSSRPSRPMETVILDSEQKSMIVRDMNEYLHPASPRWYATRGIPYRRGYLFHGPPGTGKTSLSFALAGIFGLEIYAISLQEPTLTEGDLLQLFNGLPRRCIVLLEDVDAAGLLRDSQSEDKDKPRAKKEAKKDDRDGTEAKEKAKDEDFTLKDLARELKAIAPPAPRVGRLARMQHDAAGLNRPPGTGISLSGLLNAIDGVASAEGRVLIMTTNHPEKLDAALVRPGRVDRKVEFQLAKRAQISELFVRMYAASDQVPDIDLKLHGRVLNGHTKKSESSSSGNTSATNGKPTTNGHTHVAALQPPQPPPPPPPPRHQLASLSEADLEELSLEFAGHIPDHTFTPAEIQNHLMKYKKEPRTAVELARLWADELLAEKEKDARARERGEEDDA